MIYGIYGFVNQGKRHSAKHAQHLCNAPIRRTRHHPEASPGGALAITPGSKVECGLAGGGARFKLVEKRASSRIEEGSAILDYKGPRIPIEKMHGEVAIKKTARRARR